VTDDPRVDELRQQLRSLGYLDAGVDRFVLAPAVRSRRPAVIALLASLRSGIIAGALLGPAAAVGIGARLPGLVTGMRDATVIAVYLAVLSGAAVTVLSFGAALLVSSVARSAGSRGVALSTAAGVVVSVGCLAYLTLWWRTANAGFGWDAPVWTAFALLIAVAISLLIGHVVTLTARAIVVAQRASHVQQPRVPGASWKLAIAAGVLAFLGAASLLVVTAETTHINAASPLTIRSTGARITVVAIDGFDSRIVNPLQLGAMKRPAAPFAFDGIGRAYVELSPADTADPARLWTTIATGRRPEAHGVQRLQTRRVAGLQGRLTSNAVVRVLGGATDLLRLTRPTTASNVERRVKTFWEVAAHAGLRAGVVNWWATWPADQSAGTVISDRAILRLEHGGVLNAELAPATLYEQLKSRWPTLRADASKQAAAFFSGNDPNHSPLPAPVRAVLLRSGELDGATIKLASELGTDLDLLVLYLPGLDIAQHTLFGSDAPAPSEVDERLAGLRRYYDFLDRLLDAARRPLVLITQPGRQQHANGVLAAADLIFQSTRASGTVLDVAPTILHALGVPVARDLDGRVIEAVFALDFKDRYPVRFVDTYGLKRMGPTPRGGQPLDDEMIERLRSLGYVR
jgi:hypothetical protein